jgi:hypothetical protein
MEREVTDSELIAAYHAERMTPEERVCFEARISQNPALAREVDALAGVSDWLRQSFATGPSTPYRLSPERVAVIRAAARGDIVEFPAAPAPALPRRRSALSRIVRRYGLASAAAAAMLVGGVSGFETGRVQYTSGSAPMLLAVDLSDSGESVDAGNEMRSYVPAYGLDHADFRAMVARGHHSRVAPVAWAESAGLLVRDYGLPGPGSAYLRSGELLFLQ